MKRLEDHIVPLVHACSVLPGIWHVTFHGTAFFIDERGMFLTASHVMRNAHEDFKAKGGCVGLVVRHPKEPRETVATVSAVEAAGDPNDIAIGQVLFDGQQVATKGAFVLPSGGSKLWMWQDVWELCLKVGDGLVRRRFEFA
jgi:hypothetical protein